MKTYDAAIGVDADQQPVELVTERAAALGKATGLVTTVPVSHATPAGFGAHDVERDNYKAITNDYLGSDLDVVMGAGHPLYTDDHATAEAKYKYISKADWAALTSGATPFTFVDDATAFQELTVAADPPDRVFGVAQVATTLQERRSGDLAAAPYAVPFNEVPDLTTLTMGALNVLRQDPDGLFLMVEGGAIDWAGHDNSASRLIEEELAFYDTVQAVVDWVERESSWDETLLVVTADHESGHLSAPGSEAGWKALTGTKGQVPAHVWGSEDHTNSLVPLFAKGAGASALAARADSVDPVRGQYLDNTEVAQTDAHRALGMIALALPERATRHRGGAQRLKGTSSVPWVDREPGDHGVGLPGWDRVLGQQRRHPRQVAANAALPAVDVEGHLGTCEQVVVVLDGVEVLLGPRPGGEPQPLAGDVLDHEAPDPARGPPASGPRCGCRSPGVGRSGGAARRSAARAPR